jgi:electron transport complex protein RnfD
MPRKALVGSKHKNGKAKSKGEQHKMTKLLYGGSPQVRGKDTTRKIMINVCIALLPASVMSVVYFGLNALAILLVSIITAFLAEFAYLAALKYKPKEILEKFDFSSIVTGMLLALNMPPLYPSALYVPVISVIFAIIIVKMLFGGTGCNFANPAAAARVFAVLSFGSVMTGNVWKMPLVNAINGEVELITGATPLTALLNSGSGTGIIPSMGYTTLDLLLGTGMPGSIGETCKIALILGGIYLVIIGVLDFRWPLIYIAVTGLFTVVLNGFNFNYFLPSILTGGLILGAIFMATDYTTTPNTKTGNYIYFVALGLLTATLRQATKTEAVTFSILLMNLLVPLIDKYIVPKPFGYVGKEKRGTEK